MQSFVEDSQRKMPPLKIRSRPTVRKSERLFDKKNSVLCAKARLALGLVGLRSYVRTGVGLIPGYLLSTLRPILIRLSLGRHVD